MNSSSSGNVTDCQPQVLHHFIPSLLTIVFIVGFFLNSASLWIFWFHIKNWNSGMVLQFNLALTDAIITIAAPLMITYFWLGNHWPFGDFLCQLKVFLLSTHMYGSLYFLMLISIHRYIAIVRHRRRSLFRRKSFIIKVCLVAWLILFLQGFVFFFFLKTSVLDGATKCMNIHQSEISQLFFFWNMVYLGPSFLLPLCISLACYAHLGVFISRMSTSSLRGQVMRTRSIQIITVSLFIFIVCFVPVHISRTMAVIVKYFSLGCNLLLRVEIAYYISWVFTAANCCLDPLLYIFTTETFYRSFIRLTSQLKLRK